MRPTQRRHRRARGYGARSHTTSDLETYSVQVRGLLQGCSVLTDVPIVVKVNVL